MIYLAHMIGAIFLVNSVPHFVHGVCGYKFQSPFAKPPGVGVSSPESNVLWGGINFIIGYFLLFELGQFIVGANLDTALVLAAGWLSAFAIARYFKKLKSGEGQIKTE